MNKHKIIFLIGCPRTGSTFIHSNLRNNKKLNVLKKENHFFISKKTLLNKSNFKKDKRFLIDKNLKYYITQLSLNKVNIDINTLYFYDIDSLLRIKYFFPKSEFICILRDPVQRHYSHCITQIKKFYLYKYSEKNFISLKNFLKTKNNFLLSKQMTNLSNYSKHINNLRKNKISCKYFLYEKIFVDKSQLKKLFFRFGYKKKKIRSLKKIHSSETYDIKFDKSSLISKIIFFILKRYFKKKIILTIAKFKNFYPSSFMKKKFSKEYYLFKKIFN